MLKSKPNKSKAHRQRVIFIFAMLISMVKQWIDNLRKGEKQ